MENNEIIVYKSEKAEIKPHRNNYAVTIGDNSFELKRDIDFGMITKKDGSPISSKPTLFKSGAHRLLTAYGLAYTSELIEQHIDFEKGLFYFAFKTTAYFNGQPVRTGFGCANTNEKSSGFATGWDVANTKMKLAEKRSEVDLAIKLADASGWFNADLEDTKIEEQASNLQKDDDFINAKQTKRIFAIASTSGITVEKAKELLASWGYTSTKDIKVKDYDSVCERLENYNKEENK